MINIACTTNLTYQFLVINSSNRTVNRRQNYCSCNSKSADMLDVGHQVKTSATTLNNPTMREQKTTDFTLVLSVCA